MNFPQQLAIGLLLLLAGFWLNRLMEGYKSRKAIENQMAKIRDEKRLEFLQRQLCEFYWPLYIRLEKDRSIWKRILDVNEKPGSPAQRMGLQIEKDVVLPNHKEMVQLIETRIHLAQPEGKLMAELMEYVKRATEYQALRAAGDTSHFSTDELGTDWLHQDLFGEIKRITESLQAQYNALIKDVSHNDT